MAILGAHMSIAGGYYRAVQEAADCHCDCVQLFTKNNNQWRAKDISDQDVDLFRQTLQNTGIKYPLSHSSYLINLATTASELWQKSVDGMVLELQRAAQLGISYVVLHPGAHKDEPEAVGLERVVQALDEIHRQLPGCPAEILLETTAGQGTCLGCQFEQLAWIRTHVAEPARLGICFDTCHVFAAGYPLQTSAEYQATMSHFDAVVGLPHIKAFHLNDSKKPLGSRVDRHEHIGLGMLGLDPFRWLLNDERFLAIPMYMETPKGESDDNESWDTRNLRVLRSLVLEVDPPHASSTSKKKSSRSRSK